MIKLELYLGVGGLHREEEVVVVVLPADARKLKGRFNHALRRVAVVAAHDIGRISAVLLRRNTPLPTQRPIKSCPVACCRSNCARHRGGSACDAESVNASID